MVLADATVTCTTIAKTFGRTGVEMEALTACSVGLLTIYGSVPFSLDR